MLLVWDPYIENLEFHKDQRQLQVPQDIIRMHVAENLAE